jgi:hypothetical protein
VRRSESWLHPNSRAAQHTLKRIYQSATYRQLEDEATKLWLYGTVALYQIFPEQNQICVITPSIFRRKVDFMGIFFIYKSFLFVFRFLLCRFAKDFTRFLKSRKNLNNNNKIIFKTTTHFTKP